MNNDEIITIIERLRYYKRLNDLKMECTEPDEQNTNNLNDFKKNELHDISIKARNMYYDEYWFRTSNELWNEFSYLVSECSLDLSSDVERSIAETERLWKLKIDAKEKQRKSLLKAKQDKARKEKLELEEKMKSKKKWKGVSGIERFLLGVGLFLALLLYKFL